MGKDYNGKTPSGDFGGTAVGGHAPSEQVNIEYNPDEFTIVGTRLLRCNANKPDAVIPNGVTRVVARAFENCNTLTSLTIPKSVTEFDDYAFINGQTAIQKVNYLGTLEDWCRIKFAEAPNYTLGMKLKLNRFSNPLLFAGNLYIGGSPVCTLTVPQNLPDIGYGKYIPYGAFAGGNFDKIILPQGLDIIGARAFSYCANVKEIIIPAGVYRICKYAFSRCSNLKTVFIPKSVTAIEENAFIECKNLTVYCEAESVPEGWDKNWNYLTKDLNLVLGA